MIVEKKIWSEFFQAIIDGNKKFELRLADFVINLGDDLKLREWDPNKKIYTGRELIKQVKYVSKTKNVAFWSKEEIDKFGFQIISFN